MYALEINFQDGVSPPEILLVRRPHAIIGTSDLAHVVVEGAAMMPYELRLTRGIGREFICQAVRRAGPEDVPPWHEGSYVAQAEIALGDVLTFVTALDFDLQTQPSESPDRAGVRILRAALTSLSPVFPAVAVMGTPPTFVSFPDHLTIVIGRSRKCSLRLDSSRISGEHARVGIEQGRFWVEDLGSTNGTFVGGERVSGRRYFEPEETIELGGEFSIVGVRDEAEASALQHRNFDVLDGAPAVGYPCLHCDSALVKPARVVLKPGVRIVMGRDPACEVWVGAPHVSRAHLNVECDKNGKLLVTDTSSNGSYLNGERLTRDESVDLSEGPAVIDLKEGIVFRLYRSREDEFGEDRTDHSTHDSELSGFNRAREYSGVFGDSEHETSPGELKPLGVFQKMAARQGNRAGESVATDSMEEAFDTGFFETAPSEVKTTASFETGDLDFSDAQRGDFNPQGKGSIFPLLLASFGLVIFVAVLGGFFFYG